MKSIGVQDLPLHRPIILQKDKTLKQAAQALRTNQVGSILISDGEGILRGVLTDRDLAFALALQDKRSSDILESITKGPLIYVTDQSNLKDVVSTMIKYSIRRIPIIHMRTNGKQRCLGVITLDDLVREKLIDLSEESLILKSQVKAPSKRIGSARIKSIFHSRGQKNQSYQNFLKSFEITTGLNRSKVQVLATDTLTMILKRVPSKTGENLLSQLPHELQMQLSHYISPEDRSISGKMVFLT